MLATRVWAMALALILAGSAALGLMALSGAALRLTGGPLVAEVEIRPFPLPEGYGIDPSVVSDYLVRRMQERAASDTALRLTLGTETQAKLKDIAIPRLINAPVIREMIERIEPLANLIALGDTRATAAVTVRNRGGATLEDVALILPGALRAEGAALEQTAAGLPALSFGSLGPGEVRQATVWMDRSLGQAPPEGAAAGWIAPERGVALAAAGGQRGRVHLAGGGRFPGADLEVLPWARWVLAGVLLAVLAAGAALGLYALTARRLSRA